MRILEIGVLRGALWTANMDQGWETKEEIRAAFEAKGLTFFERKLERWREERLLPPVDQIPLAYRGSEVRYPVGTAKQAIAIQELLDEKRKFDHVGWELWWRGGFVDERHWRPQFIEAARFGDRALAFLRKLYRRDETLNSPTAVSDRIVHTVSSDSLYLKIKRRIAKDEFPSLVGAMLDIATGDFNGAISEELEPTLVRAFDIKQSKSDQILGKRLRLMSALPEVLRDIARVSEVYSLGDVALSSRVELEAARDDVRGVIHMISDFYEATGWVYGPKSFGLRLAAWVARNSSPIYRAVFAMVFSIRRRAGHSFLSSDEIKRLADDAAIVRTQSARLRALQNDPRFSVVLSAKRLRRGLRTPDEHWNHLKEIEAARIKK